ncbi:hypothetical protein V8C42DRAFT_336790 [Trichoderma barbatum]
MKRSINQTDGAGDARKPPAKRAATSTKKAATSKRALSNKNTETTTVTPSESLIAPIGKCHSVPLGPNGEFFIPQVLPRECVKATDKMLLPP